MKKSIFFILALSFALATPASAKVFHSKKSALQAAFPGATKVEKKTLYLSGQDSSWIERRAGIAWPGRVVRAYVAYQGSSTVGYGFIDTHKIRTFNETVFVVLSPDGVIKQTLVLAFHEPEQYQASSRWWQQFVGRKLGDDLSLRGEIDGITGATMTAHAGVGVARRVLALFERKLAKSR